MTEKIMNISAVPSYLVTTLKVKNVKVRESDRVITIMPVDGVMTEKNFSCPFLGIAIDSTLTVDKFLEWKREEREMEYEKELRS
ncbi:MAG: hypothetical protein FWG90_11290 [Oscillospiraceae bacterium]|nr:hypothetical protein [Oscillospiraceae bacterium]